METKDIYCERSGTCVSYESGDTRSETKYAKKYQTKHQQKYTRNTLKHKHRERVQCVSSALPNEVERICNNDQIKHKALDFTVTDTLYEKTASPRYRDHWVKRSLTNTQKHTIHNPSFKKENVLKCVHLPDIYEHLYLGNIYFAESNTCRFDIIINVSGSSLPKIKGTTIYNFDVEDNKFAIVDTNTIDMIMKILKNAELNNLRILIHCFAGTNRSPFFAVLYALRKNPSNEKPVTQINWWIDYVDKCKASGGHKNWDTLTNRSYFNRLYSLI